MNIIRMSGGLGNQMFQYALGMKLQSMGKEVKFDDINEYRGERARPIMLAVFGIEYPRATWNEITAFTDGSMDFRKRIRRKLFGRRAIEYEEQGFYDPKVLSFDSMYLKGSFQSEKYFEDILDEVKEVIGIVDLNKSGIVELSEFRKLLWKIFKAVYEARIKQEEEKRRKEEKFNSDDYF